ncbi:hypothetical protein OKW21_003674 [Catalinimonas alkaloidigena]|uniref:hypothetical protein n=1 Tax=Catalinimonas alkaloidigena TaxID=1075417 RepID=UPI00240723F2|nr:hypothetical protein [Catalinimonas alkaloidigena]MDF9798411.1 hypothetical protein [Catalinimonas alkaloidigena]
MGLGLSLTPHFLKSRMQEFPVRQLTQGPKSHWFGYYDKWQVDPSGRHVLGMEVDIPMRSPTEKDIIKIGMVDLQDNDRWTEIGESNAWGWQQGCMLQWIPGSQEEVIWNDQEDGQFVSRVLNVKTGKQRTLSKAIYALSQDGRYAVGTEFNRIQNMRPGYGYPGIPDPYADQRAPQDIGIYRMNLQTGESELIFSLAQAADIPYQGKSLKDKWHYFNHLLVSPDNKRFIFLHRWREAPVNSPDTVNRGFTTRMFTINMDGSDPYMLDPSGNTSHFIWRDPEHICAWTQPEGKLAAFYLFKDQTDEIQIVGPDKMVENGHNTYVPNTNNEWILNDTYPHRDPGRRQTLYLYHVPTDRKVVLGKFFEPQHFNGEWRCDLHPRSNQQGTQVIFDSTHQNNQRQMYMVDIGEIIA